MEKTFQEYVDEKYNIKTLGPYDLIEFYKKMREPIFKKELYDIYMKNRTPISTTHLTPPINPIIIPK
jgi:hypothetical protein